MLQKHDPRRAILQFQNAIQALPTNAEAYYQIGLAYFSLQDYRTAATAFLKAVEFNKHKGARLRIAQMKADTNNKRLVEEAERDLRSLSTEGDDPDSEAVNTLAMTELKLGHADNAIEDLERAIAQAPPSLRTLATLAQAKLAVRDPAGAEQVLQRAVKEFPKSADPHRILAEFYVSQLRLGDASHELQVAVSVDPLNGPALYDQARLQYKEGDKQQAEQNFKRLSAIEGYHSIYAVFLFVDGRQDQSIHELERLVKQDPDDRQTRTYLIVAYRATHNPEAADRILSAALKKNPKDLDALLQHAETGLEKRDYSQAEMDLNRVLALKPDPEVYFLLARLNQARGDVLLYRQNLAEALRLNPRLLAVRVELVQSLVANAAGAQAALDYLNQAPADQQATLPVIVARNWAYWTLGDLAQMRKGIDLGLSRERSAELLMQDGLWKLRSGNPQAARASLEEALKINPGDLRALEALQQTYIADKNNATALQKVKEYANESKSVPAQDFLAMLLMAKGDKVQARSVLVAAKAADPQFIQADLELVQLDYAEHKLPDARKRLEELVARDNGNAVAHLWLSVIDEHMGDYNNAIAHLQQVVTLAPNDAHASNNLAYLLAESRNEPDSALKYAQRAVELQPSDPAYRDTLGWVLYRKGQYSQAVQNLEIAGSRQGNPVWKYHLAMAYAKNGDIPRGRTILDAALKLNPNLPEAQAARQLIEAAR